MNTRFATMDSTSLVPELSLGQFRTVTRQVGRSKNGTNRNVRKLSKVNAKLSSTAKPKLTSKVNAKANAGQAARLGGRQSSNSNGRSVSNGKPTYVNPDEPKLATKSGKVFANRFHARVVRGWNAIKKALRYVVQNARKHQVPIPAGQWDRFSSGHYRHARSTKAKPLPILHASGSYLIMCATLQLLPREFQGPHYSADPTC
ncbi:MAG: hypothetical protein ACI87A_000193 [Planctomycetota bacterium]|jgi:hypothetical protein